MISTQKRKLAFSSINWNIPFRKSFRKLKKPSNININLSKAPIKAKISITQSNVDSTILLCLYYTHINNFLLSINCVEHPALIEVRFFPRNFPIWLKISELEKSNLGKFRVRGGRANFPINACSTHLCDSSSYDS